MWVSGEEVDTAWKGRLRYQFFLHIDCEYIVCLVRVQRRESSVFVIEVECVRAEPRGGFFDPREDGACVQCYTRLYICSMMLHRGLMIMSFEAYMMISYARKLIQVVIIAAFVVVFPRGSFCDFSRDIEASHIYRR